VATSDDITYLPDGKESVDAWRVISPCAPRQECRSIDDCQL